MVFGVGFVVLGTIADGGQRAIGLMICLSCSGRLLSGLSKTFRAAVRTWSYVPYSSKDLISLRTM